MLGEDGLRAGPTEGRPRGEGTGAASVSRHRPHRDPENATARASSGGTLGGAGGRHLLACRLVSRRPLARDSEQVRETQEESAAGTWNSALESLSPGPLRPPGGIPEPVCGRGVRGWGLAGRGRGLSVPTGSWSVLDHAELRANATVCLVLLPHHIKALLIAFVN